MGSETGMVLQLKFLHCYIVPCETPVYIMQLHPIHVQYSVSHTNCIYVYIHVYSTVHINFADIELAMCQWCDDDIIM